MTEASGVAEDAIDRTLIGVTAAGHGEQEPKVLGVDDMVFVFGFDAEALAFEFLHSIAELVAVIAIRVVLIEALDLHERLFLFGLFHGLLKAFRPHGLDFTKQLAPHVTLRHRA